MSSVRDQWYAEVLRAGLETQLFSEADILAQATPAVLVSSLPKDVLTRLLSTGIASGTVSPASVLATANPALLAAHVPHGLLWTCIAQAAEQGGVTRIGATIKDEAARREFLRRAIESALSTTVLTPKDVIGHVDATVLIQYFPDELNSKLLETALAAGKIDAAMIVDVIGVAAMAKHAPPPVLWGAVAQAGEKAPEAAKASEAKPAPAPEAKPSPEPRPAAKPAEAAAARSPAPLAPPPAPVPEPKVAARAPEGKAPVAAESQRLDTEVPIEIDELAIESSEADQGQGARKSGLFGRLKRT